MGIKTIYTCDVCGVVIPEMPSPTGCNLITEIKPIHYRIEKHFSI